MNRAQFFSSVSRFPDTHRAAVTRAWQAGIIVGFAWGVSLGIFLSVVLGGWR